MHQSYDYVKPYLKAITHPLPQLQKTFNAEFELLTKYCKNKIVLDVGCGAGRPADKLANVCKELICIDNNSLMVEAAKKRLEGIKNIKILQMDATKTKFPNEHFETVYGTYNIVGSINEKKELIKELKRITKMGGYIIIIYWKQDRITTEFLKRYYSTIGIDLKKMNNKDTFTNKGKFQRLNNRSIEKLLRHEGLNNINTIDIGPVWLATIAKR
mgnify:CR=1 FL=1